MNSPAIQGIKATLDKIDKNVSYLIYSKSQQVMPKLKPFLVALEWSCNGLVWLAMTIILAVYNPNQTSLLPKLFIGLITDIIYVATIKALARRRRPIYANQRDQMIVASVDKHSFPSGHCSRASYVALFASHYFLQSSAFLVFIINSWAGCVCASRVLLGRHHVFDCFAGIILGWLNYTLQFNSILPINYIGLFFIRAIFGATAFSDPNDMDSAETFVE